MAISMTWHGHATFSLDFAGTKVVIDPYFKGNNPAAQTAVDDVEADFILQTHGHYDHITDTLPLASRTGAQVVSSLEIANWMNGHGYENTWAMNTGGSWSFPFGRVKMTPALHSSGLPDGGYGGSAGGYVIFAGAMNIYFSGDTALFSDLSLIGDLGLDLAVLPTGDNFTMGPDDALSAVKLLRPRLVVPGHYNTWPPIEQDMGAWAQRVQAETTARVIVPVVDVPFQLG